MNDLEQRVARAVTDALRFKLHPGEVDAVVNGVLAELPLTSEQLEGLASGDMVVVPLEELKEIADIGIDFACRVVEERSKNDRNPHKAAHQQEE